MKLYVTEFHENKSCVFRQSCTVAIRLGASISPFPAPRYTWRSTCRRQKITYLHETSPPTGTCLTSPTHESKIRHTKSYYKTNTMYLRSKEPQIRHAIITDNYCYFTLAQSNWLVLDGKDSKPSRRTKSYLRHYIQTVLRSIQPPTQRALGDGGMGFARG